MVGRPHAQSGLEPLIYVSDGYTRHTNLALIIDCILINDFKDDKSQSQVRDAGVGYDAIIAASILVRAQTPNASLRMSRYQS
jgi:hypothetical protein